MEKTANCTVYIDESGDLGVARGTKWFILSAVIVKKEDEKAIRGILNKIKTELNVKEIHLCKINDFFKRAVIVQNLTEANFIYMNVLFDTYQFDTSKIPTPIIAYNFICKYLLQSVSDYLDETEQVADIVLSARGTSRDNELIDYIQDKLFPFNGNMIRAERFCNVVAKPANSWDMLQLADVCATTTFLQHEINKLGFRVPCYSKVLNLHLYNPHNSINQYGLRYFKKTMKPSAESMRKNCVCTKKERTSGTTTT